MPSLDATRQAILERYGVWKAPSDEFYTSIAKIAARSCEGALALLYFVGEEEQWCSAKAGAELEASLDEALTTLPRKDPLFDRIVAEQDVVIVADATSDERLAQAPLVAGPPHARFYVGAPIRAADDIILGVLCVVDPEPRAAVDGDEIAGLRSALRDLATLVARELEHQRTQAEQEVAEQTLQLYKKRHELHIESTPVAFVRWDQDFRVVRWNPAAERIFGYTAEEAQGHTIEELILPEEMQEEVHEIMERLLRQEGGTYNVNKNRTKSGRIVVCEWYNTPIVDEAGEVHGVMSLALDMTEQKQVEREAEQSRKKLARERELFRHIFDAIPVMITVYDPTIDVVRVNRAFEQVVGWTNEELKEVNLMEVCYPDPEVRREAYAFMESLEEEWRDFDITTKDGSVLRTTWTNIRLSDDTLVGIGIDVSEQRQREEELRQAKEAAEEMNRLKSAFLANMSHEIRTPLTAIIGFADVLREEVQEVEELGQAAKFAALIRSSSQRLLRTINSVLDLSRLEAGAVRLRPERVAVRDEVQEAVALLQRRANEAEVALQVEEPEASLWATMDPSALHRIVVNLVGNAIKFTPSEGYVTVQLQATGEHVVIEVEDTGIGIDESFLPHLFEAFKQESVGRSRAHEGSGLGLAITHQLVKLMEGDIQVDSEKGKGTCFTVRLPRWA